MTLNRRISIFLQLQRINTESNQRRRLRMLDQITVGAAAARIVVVAVKALAA